MRKPGKGTKPIHEIESTKQIMFFSYLLLKIYDLLPNPDVLGSVIIDLTKQRLPVTMQINMCITRTFKQQMYFTFKFL